jgi:O-antigen/teichoic acid export membrane protein
LSTPPTASTGAGTLLSPSRLSANVVANSIGVAWNGLLTIVATPWYISLLGMEGYGLVGFWLVLQAVLSLLDLGLGATALREFAASEGQPAEAGRRLNLLLTLECIYWPIAAILAGVLFIAGSWVAQHWLNITSFSDASVTSSVRWMAIAIGSQFPNALYFSGLAGLQRQGILNVLQIIGNALRHGGGVAVLFWKPDPAWFFVVQAVVVTLQTLATRAVLWHLSRGQRRDVPRVQWGLVKGVWRFSAGMAMTTIAGVLLANTDRLALSKLMPASELGKYALAWTAAGLMQLGIQPFYRAYFPRFTQLFAAGDEEGLRNEYYQGCQILAALIISFAAIGLVFAPEIFRAWIGSADDTVVKVFRWLLLGVGASGLMWLPAAFQQAHGWTRLHAAMMLGALVIGVPSLWWTIGRWGAAGATAVWVLHGVSDATIGLWLMHRRLLRGELASWCRAVILPPVLLALPLVGASWFLQPHGLGRWASAIWVCVTGLVVVAGAISSVTAKSPLRILTR